MSTNPQTQTLYTSWARLTGHTLDEDTNLDPDYALDLTDEARENLQDRALAALEREVDTILEPYGAQLLGNGDIIGPVENLGDFQKYLEDECGIREEIGMIDLTSVLEDGVELAWGDMDAVLDLTDDTDEKLVSICTVELLNSEGEQIDAETVTFHGEEDVEDSQLWDAAEDAILARNGLTRDQVEITNPW